MPHKDLYSVEEIFKHIKDRNWQWFLHKIQPVDVVNACPFALAMCVAHDLIESSAREEGIIVDEIRQFVVSLLHVIRVQYASQWNKDWKNEALLGIACALVYLEEEAFVHMKNAYHQCVDPPQSLILAYIRAGERIDDPLSSDVVAELSYLAIKQGVTYEAARQLEAVADSQGNNKEKKYWQEVAKEANRLGLHVAMIVPDVLDNRRQTIT